MSNIKTVIRIFSMSLFRLIVTPRIVVTFLVAIMLTVIAVNPLNQYAAAHGEHINIIECFIEVFCNKFMMTLLLAAIVLILCDAPFFDLGQVEIIYRVGRTKWYIGKVLYIVAVSVVFQFVIFITAALISARNGYFSNVWSIPMYMLNFSRPDGYYFPLGEALMRKMNPFTALFDTFLLNLMLHTLLGMILFSINLHYKRIFGYLAAVLIPVWGLSVEFSEFPIWLSPMHYSILVYQGFGLDNNRIPSVLASVLVLGLPLLILIITTNYSLKKHSFQFGE